MEIYGEKVKLRAMEPEDMELFRQLMNDPETEKTTVGRNMPVSKYQQMKWYESAVSNRDLLRFTIVELETGKAVGLYSAMKIDWQNRSIFVSYKIASDARGKGLATDAQFAFFRYAFEEMGMHKIDESVLDFNAASKRVAKKVGMKPEGTKREAVFKNGSYHDLILLGALYEDFLEAAKQQNWMNPTN